MGVLDGKVALVTGAAQGIGHALAQGLAAEGARIVVADLRGAEEAAAGFAGGVGITADVSDEDDVRRLVDETLEHCGAIDILVNNAGLYASLEMRPFEQIPLAEWRRVMDVNVASMFLTCRAVVPVMRERGGGKIVNISSGTPFRGVPFLLHYVTSKGAIVALTRALAKELGKDSVLVNCVAPGFTMSAGVESHPEVIEKLQAVSVAARTLAARPAARRRGRRGRLPLRSRLRLHHRPDDRDRRRPDLPLILRLSDHPHGVETEAGDRVVYDVDRDEAHFGAARVTGRALVWELTERPQGDWLLRFDRVDFPPGGVAYLHTHPGPGLRVLLKGRIRIDTQGTSHEYGPFEWWYETGPDPVYAAASETEESAFVRVLVLPREWEGKRTIRYVDPADEEKPKLQRARIYFEQPLSEPRDGAPRRQAARRPARRARHRARVLRARRELPRACSTRSTTLRSG